MTRYSPVLSPLVLKILHHEAGRLGLPMPRLADACQTEALQRTPGWRQAQTEIARDFAGPEPVSWRAPTGNPNPTRKPNPKTNNQEQRTPKNKPLAIELTSNYAKRLGLPGYSSQQFSVSVETELTDLEQAPAEVARL